MHARRVLFSGFKQSMMHFLANENFPLPGIKLLRELGYSVYSIAEESKSISDEDVIRIAVDKNLIILTFDKDYGEIIFRYSYQHPPAVVYFKSKGTSPFDAAKTLLFQISKGMEFSNSFTIVDKENIRQRKY